MSANNCNLKDQLIVHIPQDDAQHVLPLVIYFAIMFVVSIFIRKSQGADYAQNASITFTPAGNDFEPAIAVAIGVFRIKSGQALAGVIGNPEEVPAMNALVNLVFWFRKKYYLKLETAYHENHPFL